VNSFRKSLVLLPALSFLCIAAVAQMHPAAQATAATQDTGKQEPPAKLFSGIGSLHHPIATSNPEAQQFFDQGLTLVYAFNFAEAIRSFKRAADLDPKEAMPYWGIALAHGPNYNSRYVGPDDETAAYDAIQTAAKLAASGPEYERDYIETLSKRFTNDRNLDPDKYDKLAHDYAAAARELSRRYPDDPDAETLYAESLMVLHPKALWMADGKPNENTLEIMQVLEDTLRKWPEHVGANHLYIHTMEGSPYPERALPSAKRLETLVPGAGHLVHMPAHIYARTGDYAAAVKSNIDAIAVDGEYLSTRAIPNVPYVMGYAEHNVTFLVYAAGMDGEYDTAIKAAKEAEAETHPLLAQIPYVEGFGVYLIEVPVRFAKWDDVLALPAPDAKYQGLTLFWHYARGCAFAAKGQLDKADEERAALEQTFKQISPGPTFGMLPNDWATTYTLATGALDARIAMARGDAAGAIARWRTIVGVEDRMSYHEPPDWYYPMRESLGAALLRAGQAADAETVFREDLQKNPRNPRSLFGLVKALQTQQKTADADWVQREFVEAWKGDPSALKIEDF
jgi:tetratricopeptide (TPR) repeat protein